MRKESEFMVLDGDFRNLAVVEEYESLIWTERYNKCGDFEIYLNSTPRNLEIFKIGYYLWKSDSEYTMIIETLELLSNLEEGDKFVVKGRSLESILDRRIVWEETTLSGTLRGQIYKLLDENITEDAKKAERRILNFVHIYPEKDDPVIDREVIEVQYMGDNLLDVIEDICESFKIGFKVCLYNGQFRFYLYTGKDRSYDQNKTPFVAFSPSFDNLVNSDYINTQEDYRNTALVAGEGTGSKRTTLEIFYTENDETKRGLDRREMYVDARDLSKEKLTASKYKDVLKTRGIEKLKEQNKLSFFDGEMDTEQQWSYGEDFFMGDILQAENQHGIERKVRVTEFIYSKDQEGENKYPTFEVIEEGDWAVGDYNEQSGTWGDGTVLPSGGSNQILSTDTNGNLVWVDPPEQQEIPTKVSQLENDVPYAGMDSPIFTGTPKAPTPVSSSNDTSLATTEFVKGRIGELVDGAPETLDTLKEISDALEENDDAVAALNAAIGDKVDKVAGKGLSTNDYTTTEKNKLAGISAGAEVNVQSDWNVTDTASDAFIKNKPTSLPANGGTAETISKTLPISKGGTGKTTAQDAFDALVNGVELGGENATLYDDDYFVSQYANGNDPSVNHSEYRRRKLSNLWSYIKSKSESVFIKKSGDTMTGDLVSDAGMSDNRKAIFYGGGIKYLVPSTNNHAEGLQFLKNDNSEQIGQIGIFGTPNAIEYYYMGKSFNNTNGHLKLGKVTASTDVLIAGTSMKTEMDNIKKSVSDGKAAVASAITEKGVNTAADATFAVMATNIGQIKTSGALLWSNTSNGSYKFEQFGDKWIANNRGVNSSTATSTWKVTLPSATTAYIGCRTACESADKLKITVNGVLEKTASAIMNSDLTITLNLVAGENTIVAEYVKDSSIHSYGDMAYVVLPAIGQQPGKYQYMSKSVTPGSSSIDVYPDNGYDGLYRVTVAASSGGSSDRGKYFASFFTTNTSASAAALTTLENNNGSVTVRKNEICGKFNSNPIDSALCHLDYGKTTRLNYTLRFKKRCVCVSATDEDNGKTYEVGDTIKWKYTVAKRLTIVNIS